MAVFGSEPDARKPRSLRELQRRMLVLALRVCDELEPLQHQMDETEARERLKDKCVADGVPYDSTRIQASLNRALWLRR